MLFRIDSWNGQGREGAHGEVGCRGGGGVGGGHRVKSELGVVGEVLGKVGFRGGEWTW